MSFQLNANELWITGLASTTITSLLEFNKFVALIGWNWHETIKNPKIKQGGFCSAGKYSYVLRDLRITCNNNNNMGGDENILI